MWKAPLDFEPKAVAGRCTDLLGVGSLPCSAMQRSSGDVTAARRLKATALTCDAMAAVESERVTLMATKPVID